jgi:hypothetical protein
MAMGLSLKNVLAAAVGAFISLRFFEGGTALGGAGRTFVSGTAIGAWLSAPMIIFFEQKPSLEVGTSFDARPVRASRSRGGKLGRSYATRSG